jgi:hypothetical protein
VSVGGPISNGAVTVKRVVLRHEGHNGTWVVGSTNVGASTFQFNSLGLAGVLFNGPVTVYCTPFTEFRGGPDGAWRLDRQRGDSAARCWSGAEGPDQRAAGVCGTAGGEAG